LPPQERLKPRFYLIDFWRWGKTPPPKINFVLRPVGAPEIFTPVLKRTQQEKLLALF
jgi:hypothetical protein